MGLCENPAKYFQSRFRIFFSHINFSFIPLGRIIGFSSSTLVFLLLSLAILLTPFSHDPLLTSNSRRPTCNDTRSYFPAFILVPSFITKPTHPRCSSVPEDLVNFSQICSPFLLVLESWTLCVFLSPLIHLGSFPLTQAHSPFHYKLQSLIARPLTRWAHLCCGSWLWSMEALT